MSGLFGLGGLFTASARARGQDLVALDLSGVKLKLVHLPRRGTKREMAHIVSKDITGLSDQDIAKTILMTFDELQITAARVYNVVPSYLVITKNIEIPSTDPKEIKEIINLQAGRHTPFSREEIIVDYIDIGTFKHSYTKVLLIIVARNAVKRQSDILYRTGLNLEKILFAPEGMAYYASRILKTENADSPSILVHVDEISTDFLVTFKGKVIFVRNISIGIKNLASEMDRYEARFIEELKSSLDAYQSENIERQPNLAILTGRIDEVRALERIASDALHMSVKTLNYLADIVPSDMLKASPDIRQTSFFSLIASLLSKDHTKVDLIPEEVRVRRALEERGKDLVAMGVYVLVIVVLAFFTLTAKIYFKSAYLKKLDARYTLLETEARSLEKDYNKISAIKGHQANRGYALEILTELHALAPLEIEVTDIRFDEQGRFSVKGTAEAMSTVFSFVDALSRSPYFSDVKTKYTAQRKEAGRDVTDFEIIAQLKKKSG